MIIKNVLSLFDGMSCGQIALNRVGIKYENYYASEIDKYAITVTQANFPNTIQLGDITKINAKDLPKIDLIIGGSPCQGFSFAGKQLNFEDERSKLFFEYVRLVNELKPKYFLLENVRMKQEYEDVISKYMNIQPIKINSNLVSAQNRNRLFWTNINSESDGLFGDLVCKIPQPKDKGILLKDILESEVDEKYFLSEKMISGFMEHNKRHIEEKNQTGFNWKPKSIYKKSNTLRANAALCPTDNTIVIAQVPRGYNKGGILANNDKMPCLTSNSFEHNNFVGLNSKQILQINDWNLKSNNGTQPFQQDRIYDINGITPALNANKSDLIIAGDFRYDEGFRPRKNGKTGTLKARDRADESCGQIVNITTHNLMKRSGDPKTGGTGHLSKTDNKSYCLDTTQCNAIEYGSKFRRLTPIECERLQTVPDNYTNYVSDSQRYKMLGNGWTVDVIAHIFSYLEKQI